MILGIRKTLAVALAGLGSLALGGAVLADEGMWAFDNLPAKHLKQTYGFEPTPEWINHLRSSAVRFNNGGSGSFVSADGLIMTNHHVGADTLQKISTSDRDYYKTGFLAKTRADEIPAKDLELNVLAGIEDVTAKVNASVKDGMSDADAGVARRAAMAEIEKASQTKTGLRSDVVTLYQGGRYALYTYKKYTDIRLVMAPEFDIAFFGGDPDNFEFPRYDLDVCFFRAYEDGKPAKIAHHLTWSKAGAKDGELIFVAGHPGRTNRLNTVAHLEYFRDTAYPFQLDLFRDREAFLLDFGKKGAEQARQAKEELFSYQNSRKARTGGLEGLRDNAFMERKTKDENELRAKIAADPAKKVKYGYAWDKIAESKRTAAELLKQMNFIERGLAFDSELFRIARTLVRLADETNKPNAERLREFRDSNMESLKQELFSEAPIYPEFEEAKLGHSMMYWRTTMGPEDPLVKRVLQNRRPIGVSRDLVIATKLADVGVRKKLAEGGSAAIAESRDPMILLAKSIDAEAREVRKKFEDQVEAVDAAQYALIAQANFEAKGDSVYPDATFTLRLAFGTVKGYEQEGRQIKPFTKIGGAFEHAEAHGNQPPYQLPPSWFEARKEGRLTLDTPLNFVSTADIIGGNSGSPVVNRDNEVVGLIFDGNIHSLVLDFGYEDRQARAVSVDSRGIVEALKSIYRADTLVEELTRRP